MICPDMLEHSRLASLPVPLSDRPSSPIHGYERDQRRFSLCHDLAYHHIVSVLSLVCDHRDEQQSPSSNPAVPPLLTMIMITDVDPDEETYSTCM